MFTSLWWHTACAFPFAVWLEKSHEYPLKFIAFINPKPNLIALCVLGYMGFPNHNYTLKYKAFTGTFLMNIHELSPAACNIFIIVLLRMWVSSGQWSVHNLILDIFKKKCDKPNKKKMHLSNKSELSAKACSVNTAFVFAKSYYAFTFVSAFVLHGFCFIF